MAESDKELTLHENPIAGAWVVESPANHLAFQQMPEVLTIRLRPNRYYVVTDSVQAAAELPRLFAAPMVIACSQQRVWLVLKGRSARAMLDRLTPLDLRAEVFPEGTTASGQIGQIDVMIHARAEGAFDLFPLRSYAGALAESLPERLRLVG